MLDKKLLGLIGGVGSANLIVTLILSLGLNPGTTGASGLPGSNGENGLPGSNGEAGQTPYIGENGNWWIGSSDTGVPATGPAGENGGDGEINILETIDFYVADFDLNQDSIDVPTYEGLFDKDAFLTGFNALSFTDISTEAELRAITGGGNYRLVNDITLTSPFPMIGDDFTFFTINFDGNGHTIYDLNINDENSIYVGMFSQLMNSTVVNLTLSSPTLQSTTTNGGGAAGLLAGYAANSVFYQVDINGESTSSLEGSYAIGGLVGRSVDSVFYDIMLEDYTVKGFSKMGGLVGEDENGLFEKIYLNGVSIIPLFGLEPEASIYNVNYGLGGLVGSGSGSPDYVDLTLRNLTIESITGSYIENPYSPGNGINLRYENVGGVVGAQSYSGYNTDGVFFANIFIEDAFIVGHESVGGLVGTLEDGLYYFINLVTQNNYILSGTEANYNGITPIPMIYEELTEENIVNLGNRAGGLVGYGYNSGLLFFNVSTNDLIIGDADNGGILGELESSNTEETEVYFKNVLNQSNVYAVDSSGGFAGSIDSGTSYFVIENSSNQGDVTGLDIDDSWNFGGFVGEVYEVEYVGLISNSYNTGNITAYGDVGGFIGYNEIESVDNHSMSTGGLIIYNTFNTGNVSGDFNVGGFLGEQYSQDNRLVMYNSLQAGDVRLQNGERADISEEEHGMLIGVNDSTTSTVSLYNTYFVRRLDTNETTLPTFGFNSGSNSTQLPLSGILIATLTGGSANSLANMDAFLSTSTLPFLFEGLWDFDDVWFFNASTQLPDLIYLAA